MEAGKVPGSDGQRCGTIRERIQALRSAVRSEVPHYPGGGLPGDHRHDGRSRSQPFQRQQGQAADRTDEQMGHPGRHHHQEPSALPETPGEHRRRERDLRAGGNRNAVDKLRRHHRPADPDPDLLRHADWRAVHHGTGPCGSGSWIHDRRQQDGSRTGPGDPDPPEDSTVCSAAV